MSMIRAHGPVHAPVRSKRTVAVVACARPSAEQFMRSFDPRPASTAMLSAIVVLMGPTVLSPPPAQAAIVGPARVVDGDTLVIGSERIRMYGLDAPESKQTCKDPTGRDYMCGVKSKEALEAKIAGQSVSCNVKDKDQYGRTVAECFGGRGENLNAWLVESGNAVAYRQYGKEYIPLEEAAKAGGRGIWAGSFQMPNEWRKQQKAMAAGSSPMMALPGSPPMQAQPGTPQPIQPIPAGVCPPGAPVIKGNISAKGDRIYHLPGGAYYNQTKIELDKGEKYFCNETDAKNAGFRASAK